MKADKNTNTKENKNSQQDDPTKESSVKTFGDPKHADAKGRRNIGTSMDHGATEKQNQ